MRSLRSRLPQRAVGNEKRLCLGNENHAQVAQLVEQRIEVSRVGGSNPSLGTRTMTTPLIEAAAVVLAGSPGKQLTVPALLDALFFLDLESLRDCGRTITNATYLATNDGAVVRDYERILLETMIAAGIVTLEYDDESKKVLLSNLLENFSHLQPGEIDRAFRATSVAWKAQDNLGWQIAFANNGGSVIDMNIALQQVVDPDPWLDEPFTAEELRVVRR